MKQFSLYVLLFLTLASWLPAQDAKAPCSCVVSRYNDRGTADTSFTFRNGRTLVLCGNREESDGEVSFTDFTLNACGARDILGHWGAVASCKLRMQGNELTIQRIVNLPVGREFGYIPIVLFIDRISMAARTPRMTTALNSKARRYGRAEINAVIAEYEASPHAVGDKTEEQMFKLFVCALSGSAKGTKQFQSFDRDTPGLEGELKTAYEELKGLLRLAGVR